jgi:hypothetical protein
MLFLETRLARIALHSHEPTDSSWLHRQCHGHPASDFRLVESGRLKQIVER